jgi:hypothetical protein
LRKQDIDKYDQQSVPFGYGDDVMHYFDKRGPVIRSAKYTRS